MSKFRFIINELAPFREASAVKRNSQYRGKYLGTISSLNEYLAFRTAHGIDDKSFKDLFLGDYFTIQDGTYNADWMVAHFRYFNSQWYPNQGIIIMPRANLGSINMNIHDGFGYANSDAHVIHCPALTTIMTNIFGEYLLDQQARIGNSIDENLKSSGYEGFNGATNSCINIGSKCLLASEIQIYGSMVWSSSAYDEYAVPNKLAVFNFIGSCEFASENYWLRDAAAINAYCAVEQSNSGWFYYGALRGFRPLLHIG